MATYHLSVSTVSRGKGGSSVNSAAYRNGQRYKDENIKKWSADYSKKSVEEVVARGVFFPEGEKEMDVSQLWNKAEAAERKSNATTAITMDIALPHELNLNEQRELVNSFVMNISKKHQLAGDFAIHHLPHNEHAHIGLTTRRFVNGELTEKAREWNIANGGRDTIESLRAQWATMVNERYEAKGLTCRIDHRSYERQGIEKEPGHHFGPGSKKHLQKQVKAAEFEATKCHIQAVKAQRKGRELGHRTPERESKQEVKVEKKRTQGQGLSM